jgi:hypothetical protein
MAKSGLFPLVDKAENSFKSIFGKSDSGSGIKMPEINSAADLFGKSRNPDDVRTMTVQTQAPVSEQPKAESWYKSDPNVGALVNAMMERTYG